MARWDVCFGPNLKMKPVIDAFIKEEFTNNSKAFPTNPFDKNKVKKIQARSKSTYMGKKI
ncbi:hypothetical protein PABG_11664 [Paracoccidioides brasiliensis Pb03]|nr:hypothetical protein PABG_11664 [Paracoccidioides brasiliensis Pb03]